MRNLIYFPNFEPPSQEWLKFSLLYFESFNPIIPESGQAFLSEDYKRIINETDLISPYRPTFELASRASINAIEFLDKVKENPHRYADIFGIQNITRRFTATQNFSAQIFREKYNWEFSNYLQSNKYSDLSKNGIVVSEELAYIYLSYLAEEIAYEEGKSIITDNRRFDNFLSYKKRLDKRIKTNEKFVKGIFNLVLPKNISMIDIDKIIKFRNNNRDLIASFNNEFHEVLQQIENGFTEEQFIAKYRNLYSELTSAIIKEGAGVLSIPMETSMLMQSGNLNSDDFINVVSTLGIVIGATIGISSKWKEINQQRSCRKYLTNLQNLR